VYLQSFSSTGAQGVTQERRCTGGGFLGHRSQGGGYKHQEGRGREGGSWIVAPGIALVPSSRAREL